MEAACGEEEKSRVYRLECAAAPRSAVHRQHIFHVKRIKDGFKQRQV